MIRLFYGEKGTGKTKQMLDTANSAAAAAHGNVVFIDEGKELMYDLRHEIRFINISDYPIHGIEAMLGFVCGLSSGNYDISSIFIDRITYMLHCRPDELESFFMAIERISDNSDIDFFISMNGTVSETPDFIKKLL